MKNIFYRFLLTTQFISLIVFIFFISNYQTNLFYFILFFNYYFIFSFIGLQFIKKFDEEEIKTENILEVEQANNNYLINYLSCFSIALITKDINIFILISFIIAIISFKSEYIFFNLCYLLLGYSGYSLKLRYNKNIFVLSKSEMIAPCLINFKNLRKISASIYIELPEEKI